MNDLCLSGRFRWEIWSAPKDILFGRVHRDILDAGEFANGIITASINDLLDVYFSNGSPQAAWYLGLIDDTNFSELSAADSMSSHAGWQELTDYSEGTRPAWGPGNAASGVKTNESAVVFTAAVDCTVKGLLVASDSTKSGTTGLLWSTGTFSTEKNLAVGQTLRVFYEARGRQG